MASELRRTAKAAGLNPVTEESEVLRQLLDAPATAKAAAGFWSAYRAALMRLAREDPAMRGVLLNLHPSPPEGSQDFVEWWIQLLRDSGSLDALIRPEGAPASTLPLGSPAEWLERTAKQANVVYYWRSRPAPMAHLLDLVAEIDQSSARLIDRCSCSMATGSTSISSTPRSKPGSTWRNETQRVHSSRNSIFAPIRLALSVARWSRLESQPRLLRW